MTKSKTHTVNRSSWQNGPWDQEPDDKIVWVDSATNLDCMMLRNGLGAWCGYVGLPSEHPEHGKHYNSLIMKYSVHGGLTFSNSISDSVQPERSPDVWWLGFDCNHFGDYAPGDTSFTSFANLNAYRTQSFVKSQVESLAKQCSTSGMHTEEESNEH